MVRTLIPRVWRPFSLLNNGWEGTWASVLRSDPFREVFDVFGGFDQRSEREGFLALDAWETPQSVQIEVDLPGVDVKDVHVQVERGELTLNVERPEAVGEGDRWVRRERSAGSFTRTLALPAEIDPEGVSAELAEGVLRITLRKAKEVQPRTIQVKALEG
jgi:HSP20 family protein